jgi:glycerophosphoryl diester phosphodiesterase
MTGSAAPRVKWHMLRRRASDPPFQRANLAAALATDAACEVDLVISRDGHAVCLHDRTLDRETTGAGPVHAASRAEIAQLRQRDNGGAVLVDPPLFLDELVAFVRRHGSPGQRRVQLDVKAPARALTQEALDRVAALLDGVADRFVASAHDWEVVRRLTGAVPGLHAGYDPLALYARPIDLDADGFRAIATRARAIAPGASIYYLEARLVLAARAHGIDLVAAFANDGAEVDAWTLDADLPDLRSTLERLLAAGCHQITSNDPLALADLIAAIASAATRDADGAV